MVSVNNNLKSLYIDGKPVKKASLGGKVFFEKHNYNLDLVSDKDILSYYDEDSATLTATLTDYGEPVAGETVLIYDSNKISRGTYTAYGNTFDTFIIDLNDEGSLVLSAGGEYRVYNNDGNIKSWTITSHDKWTFVVSDGKLHIYEGDSSGDYGNYNITADLRLEFIPHSESVPTLSFPTIFHIGTTDSNGECSVVYDSKGTGDINIKCEAPDCSLVSEIYELKDIYFARMTEYSLTKSEGYVSQKFIDETTSLILPDNFEMEFLYKTTGGSSSNEMRLFMMPRSLFVQNTQPIHAWFIGDTGCNYWQFGVRRNGTALVHYVGLTCNSYYSVKFTMNKENKRVYCYIDGNYVDYYTLPSSYDYSDYCLCFHNWANGTLSIKDITIKKL